MSDSALVDSSVWIEVWRPGPRERVEILERHLAGHQLVFSRFVEIELLAGARNEEEWRRIADFLAGQASIEAEGALWAQSARIYFDLRRRGVTVRSITDCCLAQQAMDHDLLVLHRDRDFESIAAVRPLRQQFVHF